ncbi:MAG: hypothetical protein WCX74_01005 [Candidatus Paceibacterota bacterium]
MKKNELIASLLTVSVLAVSLVGRAIAGSSAVIFNPLNIDDLPSLLCIIFDGLIYIGVPILTLVIVLAGLKWITSMGDSSKITEARNAITYAVLGMIVILSSKAIFAFIVSMLEPILGGSITTCD